MCPGALPASRCPLPAARFPQKHNGWAVAGCVLKRGNYFRIVPELRKACQQKKGHLRVHSTLSTVPIDKTSPGVGLETEIHSHLYFFALLKLHRRCANRHKRDETISVSDPACWMSEIYVIGKEQAVSLTCYSVSEWYEKRCSFKSELTQVPVVMEILWKGLLTPYHLQHHH